MSLSKSEKSILRLLIDFKPFALYRKLLRREWHETSCAAQDEKDKEKRDALTLEAKGIRHSIDLWNDVVEIEDEKSEEE